MLKRIPDCEQLHASYADGFIMFLHWLTDSPWNLSAADIIRVVEKPYNWTAEYNEFVAQHNRENA